LIVDWWGYTRENFSSVKKIKSSQRGELTKFFSQESGAMHFPATAVSSWALQRWQFLKSVTMETQAGSYI